MARRPDDIALTDLALRAKAGDRAATTAFIEATQHDVHRFLCYLTNPVDAPDLAQETFLRAMRALPRFAARSSARTWLLAIARRVAADHLRAAASRPQTSPFPVPAEQAVGADPHRADEHHALTALLDQLPTEQRHAFVATQILGLSYLEAAHVCACPVGTIRSRIARARNHLIDALHQADQEQDERQTPT